MINEIKSLIRKLPPDNINSAMGEKVNQYLVKWRRERSTPGNSDIHFNGYIEVGDEIYVQLEAPYNVNTGKTFMLLVKPEIRVIDYWTGNG